MGEERSLLSGLGRYRSSVDSAIQEFRDRNVIERIWAGDHTVWKPQPTEITNRLGWLRSAEVIARHCKGLAEFATDLHQNGYTRVLLLGMGGSSLAPEVFHKTFGVREGALTFDLLDTTAPDAIFGRTASIDPLETVILVSTKSGGTVETLSLFKHFYTKVRQRVGPERTGRHFLMITDPGSTLVKLGEEHGVRAVFLNDPDIGGRYSALTYFGLLPAALMGVDLAGLLARASEGMRASGADGSAPGDRNPALELGLILGELARQGRDKVTFVTSEAISGFGDWAEQLIAESTGKEGRGILPVVGEPLGAPEVYGSDRLFIQIALGEDNPGGDLLVALESAGHPVVRIRLRDRLDLGYQFFLWEMATAVAGARLGINPFDQPNVESAKVRAREMMAAYQTDGRLPEVKPSWEDEGVAVFSPDGAHPPAQAISRLLDNAPDGAYVAIQAYIEPGPDMDQALASLRVRLRDRYKLATTVGYGPRFLHSTGQLHKGDAGLGRFIQITGGHRNDVPVPEEPGSEDSSVSFGTIIAAQALGDRQALIDAGRPVLRLHFEEVTADAILQIERTL